MVTEFLIVFMCLAAGGFVKGATGAGAPIFAVPALASFFDVRVAVVTMLVPNLLTNSWQAFRFRRSMPEKAIVVPFWAGGAFGALFGALILVSLSTRWLSLGVASVVIAYILARLARPDWRLGGRAAALLSFPAGFVSGILQGAAGISAPVSISYLNAAGLPRPAFIGTISALFLVLTLVQFPTYALAGALHPKDLMLSAFALIPVSLAMPLGGWVAMRVSARVFDTTILVILAALAAKLAIGAVL